MTPAILDVVDLQAFDAGLDADWNGIAAARKLLLDARAYVPSPKQLACHESTARVRFLATGNRFGKTDLIINEAIWWATGRHPYRKTPKPPVSIRFYMDGYEGPHWTDVIRPKFRRYLDPADVGGSFDETYKAGERLLPFLNGSTIKVLSYNLGDASRGTQAYAGAEVHLNVFDEHGQLEVYREAGARIGPGIEPQFLIAYTPLLGRAAWEYDEIWLRWERGERGYECFTGTIWDNPVLDKQAIETYLQSLPPEQRQVREDGVWTQAGGQVYPMYDGRTVPFDVERVRSSTKSLIVDPHPSRAKGHHLLWCAVDDDQRMFCYREAIYKVPIKEIADLFRAASAGEDIRRYWIDPHWGWKGNETGTSIAQQYQEAGIPVQPASADKIGGIHLMQTALDPSPSNQRAMLEVMDTCPETAHQVHRYSWKQQTSAMREADRWTTIDERDDLATCLRYFVQTDPRYQGQHTPEVYAPRFTSSLAKRYKRESVRDR